MKKIKYGDLRHGMRVTCTINGKEITNARLSIDADGRVFICQDECNGVSSSDKLGYKNSWFLCYKDSDNFDPRVTDLVLLPEAKTLDDIQAGDYLVNEGGNRVKVLARVDDVVLLSLSNVVGNWETRTSNWWHHIEELKRRGCTLPDQPDDTVELTKEQIARRFRVSVDKLRIKED